MAFTKDMINCRVTEDKMGYLTIVFDNDKSIYLQEDNRKAEFGVACGIIEAPENWDGLSWHLIGNWWEKDFEAITQCPSYYILSAR